MINELDPVRRFRADVPDPGSESWALARLALARAIEASRPLAQTAAETRGGPISRLRAYIKRHGRTSAGVILIATVAASGAVAAATGLLGLGKPTSINSDKRASLALAPDPTDYAMLGVLRRPSRPGDALPPLGGSGNPIARSSGANAALARKVSFGQLGEAWVIPADGGACLVADGNVDGRHALGGGACDGDSGGHPPFIGLLSTNADAQGMNLVSGLVPDGVSVVDIHLAAGTLVVVRVHDNVYLSEIRSSPVSTSFTYAGRSVTLKEPP